MFWMKFLFCIWFQRNFHKEFYSKTNILFYFILFYLVTFTLFLLWKICFCFLFVFSILFLHDLIIYCYYLFKKTLEICCFFSLFLSFEKKTPIILCLKIILLERCLFHNSCNHWRDAILTLLLCERLIFLQVWIWCRRK